MLNINIEEVKELDAWMISYIETEMPLQECHSDAAIDATKGIVASFWPLLLQNSHTRRPRSLFASIQTITITVTYYMRPKHQGHLSYEPPGFPWAKECADFTFERALVDSDNGSITDEAGTGGLIEDIGTANNDGWNGWVEGIWADYVTM